MTKHLKQYFYGFTMKCNRKGEGEYLEEIDTAIDEVYRARGFKVPIIRYENDSYQKLHAHGVITTSKPLLYRSIKKKGWHFFHKRVYEDTGWMRYIEKDIAKHLVDDQGSLFID